MINEVELSELTRETLKSFDVENINKLRNKIFEIVLGNQHEYYEKFLEIAPDLEIDHMQKIYQYYLADRSDLKQDYTPKSLSKLVSKLSENKKEITDICAGTGALTIQSWAEDKTRNFKIYELDENVMPFLIFNMAIRNINCEIYQADVLEEKTFRKYLIIPGERFGEVILCQ